MRPPRAPEATWLLVLVALAGLTVGWALWHSARGCTHQGGTPVHGLLWVECVTGVHP